MADTNILQALNINGEHYEVKPCWELLGLTKKYMLALLNRDEYTPVATKQPTSTDTIYTDPVSGNPAGFHAGQCVIYPDADVPDGWGLSIAKRVELNPNGVPTKVYWFHATDMEKRVSNIEERLVIIHQGCFGTGLWINGYPWQNEAVWDNGI